LFVASVVDVRPCLNNKSLFMSMFSQGDEHKEKMCTFIWEMSQS